VSELAELQLTSFLAPRPVVREGGTLQGTGAALAGAVSVASALGASSLYTWLALPGCPGFEAVAAATTLPIVVCDSDAVGEPRRVLAELRTALQAGPNVRGAVIGRTALSPGGDDPRAIAAATAAIIHDGSDVEAALSVMEAERGKDPQLA
jgi:DhnA family fructose-bisphosphate aldolase class Ia